MLLGRQAQAWQRNAATILGSFLAIVALLLVFGATRANAQNDNFLSGDGHSGAVTFGNATFVPNAVAPVSGGISAGAMSITRGTVRAGSGTGNVTFANNRLVMIAQMTGWTGTATSGSQVATDITSSRVGKYEFARISTVSGSTLNFTSALVNSFDAGSTQVIAVPEYTNVTVDNANARVDAQAWDGTSGGLLVVFASGTVNFSSAGWFSADSLGFRGGPSYVESTSAFTGCNVLDGDTAGGDPSGMKGEGIYPAAFKSTSPPATVMQEGRGNYLNAGAGGNCFNASGGGGANGGAGGKGGYSLTGYDGGRDVGGLGGHALTYQPYDQLAFGGAGGAGERNNADPGTGGVGGGVVYVRGGTLTGTGNFRANGGAGAAGNAVSYAYDGSGGGGAGGVVSLRFVNGLTCGSASANGGVGGNNGTNGSYRWSPGGGGGGGRVYLQGSSVACAATSNAGAAGTTGGNSYGAVSGSAGSTASLATGMATPTATLVAPANGAYVATTTPTVSGTSTANATIYVYIDGSLSGTTTANGAGAWSYDSPALSQASHTVYVRPELYGLSGVNTSTNTFTVDATAPTVAISAPANGSYTNDTTPLMTFSVTETNPNITQCRVDGGTWTACSSGSSMAALTNGSHTLDVRHTDDAGNIGSSSTTFTVDTTAPSVSLSAPANGSTTNDATPPVTFSVTETNPDFSQCSVDSGAWYACASGDSLAALTDGSHTLAVRHTDHAGNVGTSSINTFTVDTAAPAAPVISWPVDGSSTNDTTPDVSGTAEAGSTVTVYVDGSPVGTTIADGLGGWSFTITPALAAGTYAITARATDDAGNQGPASSTVNLTIDLTDPDTAIDSAPDLFDNDSSPPFTFSSNEPGSTFECSLDGGAWTSCTSPHTTGALTDGAHTFEVRATDPAGNTDPTPASYGWTVDTATPAAPVITSPADGSFTTDTTPMISGTAEAGSTVTVWDGVTLLGTTTADGSGNWSFTPASALAEGAHYFDSTATDAAGNESGSSNQVEVTIDTTDPDSSIDSAPPAADNDTTPTFTFSANEPGSTFECSLDGGAWIICTSPHTTAALTDGAHTFEVRATDQAGNVDTTPASHSWTLDTAAPVTTIDSAPPANDNSDSPSFGFSSNEPGSTFECSLDGGAWASCTSPHALSGLADGAHTFEIRATDPAGNTDATPASHSWTIDTTSPDTTIDSAPPVDDNDSTPTFAFSSNEPGGTFECSLDSGAWTSCTSPHTTGALADGAHTFEVRAIDLDSNVDPTPASHAWNLDTVAPAAPAITGPADESSTNDNTPTISGTAEANSTVVVYDGVTALGSTTADGSGNWSFTPAAPLADGSHSFTATATDAAGNDSGASNQVDVTIDTAAPAPPVITSPADESFTTDTTPTISGTAEANGTVTVHDGATALGTVTADGSGNWSFTPAAPLAEGAHAFDATATDAAGNEGTSSNQVDVTIDTVAPATTIDSAPPLMSNGSDPTFAFSSDEPVSTFECRLDLGAWTSCASPQDYFSLADGAHTFEVRATDQAGNTDATPATHSWTIDTTPPETTIDVAPPAQSNTNSPSFEFSASEPGSTFDCRIDGGAWGACASPQTYLLLTEGSHTFQVRATDALGNPDFSAASHTWTVDTAAPAAPTIDSPADETVTNDTTPTLIGTAEAGSTVTIYDGVTPVGTTTADGSGDWSFTPAAPLAQGAHSFTVTAADAAGNVGPASNQVDLTIDSVAPAAPVINSPADGTHTSDTTPTLSGTAEAGSTVTVYDGVTALGTTTADGSGNWSFTPAAPLAEGVHNFSATATDAAANEGASSNQVDVTIDTAAPVTTIDSAPPLADNDDSPSFSFSSDEPGSTFECRLDGGAWAACTSPHPLSGLADGAHTFEVRAIDQAGNVDATPAVHNWTIDTTAPDTTIDVAPPAFSQAPNPSFEFSSNEPGGTFECRLDAGTWAACTSPHGLSGLADGSHTFEVRAIDLDSNVDPTPASHTWTVDTVAPSAPAITAPADGTRTNDTTPTISGTAQAGSTVTVYDDVTLLGTTTADGSGNWSFTPGAPLSAGSHFFAATATDAAGNESGSSNQVEVIIDLTAPETTIDVAPPVDDPSNDPSFEFSSNEGGGSFECRLDAGAWMLCTSPRDYTDLADGSHTFEVRSIDIAGNTDATPASHAWTIDTVAPAAPTIDTPADESTTTDPTPTLTGTADANVGVIVRDGVGVIGATIADGSGNWSFTPGAPLADGSHSFSVTAVDTAGNTGAQSNIVDVTIDSTAPATSLTGTPPAADPSNDPSFTFSSNEPGSTFECSLDGGAWALCTSPNAYTDLPDGPHTFDVRAIDPAGNVDPTPSSHSWNIDTAAPAAPVISSPVDGSVTTDATPTVSGTAEAGATVTVRDGLTVLGTVIADGSGNWSFTPSSALAEGAHSFSATATDAAGNESAQSNIVDVTIDSTAPATSLTGTPPAADPSNDPSFTFSSNEPGSTFECSLDGGAWTLCTSPNAYTDLPDGPHTFDVRAIDPAGNVDPTPSSHSWNIDTAAPAAPVISSPANGTSSTDASPNVSGSAEPGATVRVYEGTTLLGTTTADGLGDWTLTVSPDLAHGSHSFKARATDAAGNASADSGSVVYVVVKPHTPEPEPIPISTPTPAPAPTPDPNTCASDDGEAGTAPKITVTGASASRKTLLKFKITSDQFVITRITVREKGNKVASQARAINAGKRQVVTKIRKLKLKNAVYTARLSAVSMSGGKSVAEAQVTVNAAGKWSVGPLGGDGATTGGIPASTDCRKEAGAPRMKVVLKPITKVKVGLKKMTVSIKSNQFAVTTFKLIQNGKVISRKVFVLKPGKVLKKPLKLLGSTKLQKGKITLQASTFSVDGVRVKTSKTVKVK